MTLIEAIVLGIVQGITEFLPISSSGHLVLMQHLLEIEGNGNEFEVLVHLGTLASILVVFSNDIKLLFLDLKTKKNQSYIFNLFLASLPAAIAGIWIVISPPGYMAEQVQSYLQGSGYNATDSFWAVDTLGGFTLSTAGG